MFTTFCHVIDGVNRWLGKAVSLLLFPLLAFVFLEVSARYVFNRPTIWVWDVNVQILGLLTTLGAGYTLLTDAHIKVDILVSHFSPRVRASLDLITSLSFFFCIGAIAWQSIIQSWQSVLQKKITPLSGLPPYILLK